MPSIAETDRASAEARAAAVELVAAYERRGSSSGATKSDALHARLAVEIFGHGESLAAGIDPERADTWVREKEDAARGLMEEARAVDPAGTGEATAAVARAMADLPGELELWIAGERLRAWLRVAEILRTLDRPDWLLDAPAAVQ